MKITTVIPLLTLSLSVALSASAAPPEIKAAGNHLENKATGALVRLTGVNIPSLKWSTNLEGGTAAVSHALDAWKCNTLRLSVNQGYWLNNTSNYRTTVDSVVNLASAANAYVIIDLHFTTSIDNMPDDTSITFWQSVANQYKNNPAVLFGLYNEPSGTSSWDIWRNGGMMGTAHTPGMQALLTAIRGTGANNLVVAGGLNYAGDVSQIPAYALTDTASGNGVLYDAHIYPWHHWIGSATSWLTLARQYPVLLGECGHDGSTSGGTGTSFGGNSSLLYWTILSTADALNVSYTAWAFHPLGGPLLITDFVNYSPGSYSGQFVMNHVRGHRDPAYASNLLNPSFETPATSTFAYRPSGGSWTFTGNAGIQKTWLTAITGTQTAFLQTASAADSGQNGIDGALSQTINFASTGTYTLSFLVAQRGTKGMLPISVSVDNVPISSVSHMPSSVTGVNAFLPITSAPFTINSTGNHTIKLSAVASPGNNLEALIDNISVKPTASAVILDEGFQQAASLSNGTFVYRPTGGKWTYAGNSGVERGAWGAPNAPSGSGPNSQSGFLAAFLQTAAATDSGNNGTDGTITQNIEFAAPGAYAIKFYAAQRTGKTALPINILIDGAVIGAITPTATAFSLFTSPTFEIKYPGYHTLQLAASPSPGTDKEALIDGIQVLAPAATFTRPQPVPIAVAGFESPTSATTLSYERPTGIPWTFTGKAGVQSDRSGFRNYDGHHAPEGYATAYISSDGIVPGTASQSINFPAAGSYVLNFQAQRGRNGVQPLTIAVDGAVVGNHTPPAKAFYPYTTPPFTVTAGNHTVSFTGDLTTGTGKWTIFDAINIWPVSISGGGGSPLLFEAESLAFTATKSTTLGNETAASGGQLVAFNATAVNDQITFTLPSVPAGTYSVKVRFKKSSNRGICQLAIDGANQGTEQDTYYSGSQYVERDLGSVTLGASGNRSFRFTLTGKNTSSSGYVKAIDYIKLVP